MGTHQNRYLRETLDHEGTELREMSKIARLHAEKELIKVLVLPKLVGTNLDLGWIKIWGKIFGGLYLSVYSFDCAIVLISRNFGPSCSEVYRKYQFWWVPVSVGRDTCRSKSMSFFCPLSAFTLDLRRNPNDLLSDSELP